jgi:tripartite-type tricarboxylate transporter receptor subunit TctC
MQRRQLIQTAAAASTALALPAFAQSGFPNKPIRLIVPWAAGGSTDVICRVVADQAGKFLGQTMVVDNRPGGSTTVGLGVVASAAPDGYTLGQMPVTTLRIAQMEKISFDPVTDLAPVIGLAIQSLGIVVRADSPFKSIKDIIDAAKNNPGKLNYGSTGNASGGRLYTEQMLRILGLNITYISYNGSAPLQQAILGGQIDFGVDSGSYAPLVQAGKMRLLLAYSDKKLASFPQAPTLKEAGLKLETGGQYGIVAPKGTPKNIIDRLHTALKQAWETPQVQSRFFVYVEQPSYLSPEQYALDISKAMKLERKVIDMVGLLRKA